MSHLVNGILNSRLRLVEMQESSETKDVIKLKPKFEDQKDHSYYVYFKAMHDRELIGMISGNYGITNYSWCLEENVEALRLHNRRGYELVQAMFKREADYTYITEEIMNIITILYTTITEFGDLKKVL